MSEYLDRLPTKPRVQKVNAAVSDKSDELLIYYVPDTVRIAHGMPAWMKGTNKIGEPHPTVIRWLQKHGLPMSLVATRRVPVYSVSRLFRLYGVRSVDFLKIDTEGHDPVILNAYLDLVERQPGLRARKILFESNTLSERKDVAAIVERLRANGYEVSSTRQDTMAVLGHIL